MRREGPTVSFPPPLFLLGGPIEATGCGPNVAWAASAGGHFDATKGVDSINPTFKDSVGQARTQCGDMLFQNQAGSVRIRWAPSPVKHLNATNIWQVKYRRTDTQFTDSMAVVFQQVVPGGTIKDTTFGVVLDPRFDAVSFRAFIGTSAAPDPAAFDNSCDNACAQHWRRIIAPVLDSVPVIGTGHDTVRVSWTNGNWTRSIDSTEVYRNEVLVGKTPGTTRAFLDGPLGSGTYRYQVRHVAPPSPNDHLIGRPNSAYSAEDTAQITNPPPPPPPTALECEGNFAATMDCGWTNTVIGVTTEIFRNGGYKATLAAGVSAWTDLTVVRGTSYEYKVRHVDPVAGAGSFGTPVNAVANPVAPENLSCGRTGATTASCAWVPQEPGDSVEIQRAVGTKNWTTRGRLGCGASPPCPLAYFADTGLVAGTGYNYRVRYVKGSDASAWSNLDAVGTTWPEPYGPQGP